MMRSCVIGMALVAMVGVGCSGDQGRSNVGGQHGSAPGEGGGASGAANPRSGSGANNAAEARLTAADQQFVQTAAKGNEAEVDMAKMAEDKAQNENVKQYAEMLERDHSNALDELRQIAQHSNVSLDNNAPAAEKASMSNRLNATGTRFDREFMTMMIEHHRKDIAEFERMQNSATGEVKAFIEKTLPVVRQHLARGEELMKGMGTN